MQNKKRKDKEGCALGVLQCWIVKSVILAGCFRIHLFIPSKLIINHSLQTHQQDSWHHFYDPVSGKLLFRGTSCDQLLNLINLNEKCLHIHSYSRLLYNTEHFPRSHKHVSVGLLSVSISTGFLKPWFCHSKNFMLYYGIIFFLTSVRVMHLFLGEGLYCLLCFFILLAFSSFTSGLPRWTPIAGSFPQCVCARACVYVSLASLLLPACVQGRVCACVWAHF